MFWARISAAKATIHVIHRVSFFTSSFYSPRVMLESMPDFNRRTILSLAPTIATLIASEAGIVVEAKAQGRGQQPAGPQRVSKEQLKAALEIIGMDFTEAQRDQMLPGVNRALTNYEALRKVDVPLDTEPAFHFRPSLPGKEPKPRPSKFLPTRVTKLPSFKDPEELCFLPVTDLSAMMRARKITSTDLTKMYLARLKKYAPKLLCVITLTEELALEQAARADKEIASGKYKGPLHGIPYGAKDLFNTKGIKTTWGAEPFQEQVPTYTCTAIDRLEKAGAVLLAKLSMGALAQGDRWFAGVTKNPWNLEQGSSGSSAGSASATSAGLVGFAIGTETQGSIVSPSTRCGVTGLRPTYGRVSRYGAMGLSWTMDKIGPICRSVEDSALVLNAMYGPDGHDVTTIDAPFDWNPAMPIANLKIGYLKNEFERTGGGFGGQTPSAEAIAARKKIFDDAFEALRKAGAKLEATELPAMNAQPLGIILQAEAGAAFDDITRDGRVSQLSGQGNGDWPNSFRTSRMTPAVEYIRAMRQRTILQQQMHEFMEKWDVLIVPSGTATLQITNLTGHPQVAVPCGFLNGNNPQSILFTGRLYEEGTPLRVALAFEQATEWHKMHPKVDWA
jgi:Asp-tRNA(Asn)/Glu-tRNA(Gln) amidotransferase A subunit family amidase